MQYSTDILSRSSVLIHCNTRLKSVKAAAWKKI